VVVIVLRHVEHSGRLPYHFFTGVAGELAEPIIDFEKDSPGQQTDTDWGGPEDAFEPLLRAGRLHNRQRPAGLGTASAPLNRAGP
jgi:hypothetical protein